MDFQALIETISTKLLERVKVHDPAAKREGSTFTLLGEQVHVDYRPYGGNRIAIRKGGYGKHQQRIRSDEGGTMPDDKIEFAVKWLLSEVDGIKANRQRTLNDAAAKLAMDNFVLSLGLNPGEIGHKLDNGRYFTGYSTTNGAYKLELVFHNADRATLAEIVAILKKNAPPS